MHLKPLLLAGLAAFACHASAQTPPALVAELRYTYYGIGPRLEAEQTTGWLSSGPASVTRHNSFQQSVTDFTATPPNTYQNTADIALDATATFSRLHASAAATLTSTENALYVGDGAGNGGLLYASANTRFVDRFTVLSTLLPAGTEVAVTAWLRLDATISTNAVGWCDGDSYIPVGAGGHLRIDSGNAASLSVERHICSDRPLESATFTAVVGGEYPIEGSLGVSNYLFSNSDVAAQQITTGQADAGHTAYFYLTSSEPGLQFLAASGTDYGELAVTGVPEPGTWALMLAGGAVLLKRAATARGAARRGPATSRASRWPG